MNNLKDYIDNKYIRVQKHPEADLYIYNYTAQTQYEKLWDDITLSHRGLIKDGEGNVVARPFDKFMNMGEVSELPSGRPVFREKLDGSLGISYILDGEVYLATRGSFTSDQAIKGTELLQRYSQVIEIIKGNPQYTFLFEIIYPENRIVVDYGQEEKLVLLAIRNIADGTYLSIDTFGTSIPKAKTYDISDVSPDTLKTLQNESDEGFVIEFVGEDGSINGRVKYKFDEYARLHRILTEFSSYDIWESLQVGDLSQILDRVPDEFYDWVRSVESDILQRYGLIEINAIEVKEKIKNMERKDQGLYLQKTHKDLLPVVFSMIDGKDYSQVIWKKVKPQYGKAFKTTNEEE